MKLKLDLSKKGDFRLDMIIFRFHKNENLLLMAPKGSFLEGNSPYFTEIEVGMRRPPGM